MRHLLATAIMSLCAMGVSLDTHHLSFTASAYGATNPSEGFADLVEKLSPAVVNISTTSIIEGGSRMDQFFGQGIPPEFNELLNNFLGGGLGRGLQRGRPRKREVSSLGSGFVIDPDGYIVTNHHVIENASKIEI